MQKELFNNITMCKKNGQEQCFDCGFCQNDILKYTGYIDRITSDPNIEKATPPTTLKVRSK